MPRLPEMLRLKPSENEQLPEKEAGPQEILRTGQALQESLARAIESPRNARPDTVLQMQRRYGNRAVGSILGGAGPQTGHQAASSGALTVQPKLEVTSAQHENEHEADRMAGQVVQQLRGEGPRAGSGTPGLRIQRSASTQSSAGLGGFNVSSSIETGIRQARGGGQPLERGLQSKMEQSFEAGFDQVRLHTDQQADGLSRSIQAKAFTIGSDIFFKGGQYSPSSSEGQHLLAHELSHVVQNGHASSQEGSSGPSLEHQAHRAPDTLIQRTLDSYYDEPFFKECFPYGAKESLKFSSFIKALDHYWIDTSTKSAYNLLHAAEDLYQDFTDNQYFQTDEQANILWSFISAVKKEAQGGPNDEPLEQNNKKKVEEKVKEKQQVKAQNKEPDEDAEMLDVSHVKVAKSDNEKDDSEQNGYKVGSLKGNILPLNKRKERWLQMGRGGVGHLGMEILMSNEFSSCSPIIMYNSRTQIAGLYHLPAGQVKQCKPILAGMLQQVKPTEIWICFGSGGFSGLGMDAQGNGAIEIDDYAPLLRFFVNECRVPKNIVHMGLSMSGLELTLPDDDKKPIWNIHTARKIDEKTMRRIQRSLEDED